MSNKVTYVLKEAKKTRMKNIEENLEEQQSNSWLFADNIGDKLEYFMYFAIGFAPSIAAIHTLANM